MHHLCVNGCLLLTFLHVQSEWENLQMKIGARHVDMYEMENPLLFIRDDFNNKFISNTHLAHMSVSHLNALPLRGVRCTTEDMYQKSAQSHTVISCELLLQVAT